MAEYPKYYEKGDRKRVSHNVRDDVKLQFEGYRVVAAPQAEEAEAKTPELTEAEMAKLPEAKDAEVVDLTGETKPTDAELKAAEAEKAADPKAYLAKQKN